VRDHSDALWAVLKSGRVGETYNVGARHELTNIELIGQLCDIFDEMKPDAGGNSRELIKHVDDRPGHDQRYATDPSKVEDELDWQASRAFDAGLRDTVRWYTENQEWMQRAHFRIAGQETDWESCYLSGDTQWDKGMPSPGLIDWLQDSPELARGSVVVPGCGFGHDARAWAETGFKVVGHDIAPSAVRGGNERIKGSALNIEFQLGDFLQDEPRRNHRAIFATLRAGERLGATIFSKPHQPRTNVLVAPQIDLEQTSRCVRFAWRLYLGSERRIEFLDHQWPTSNQR